MLLVSVLTTSDKAGFNFEFGSLNDAKHELNDVYDNLLCVDTRSKPVRQY